MSTSSTALPKNPILAPDSAGLATAAQFIREGNLLLLPTETVYGIAVNLLSPQARSQAKLFKSQANPSRPNAAVPPDMTGTTATTGTLTAPNYVLHLATPDALLAWVPSISNLARRLITKSLPGPVAFQIKLTPADEALARKRLGTAADEVLTPDSALSTQHSSTSPPSFYLTLRCPDQTHTQKILSLIPEPVAIIGAGTPAHPAIFELADLDKNFFRPQNSGGVLDTKKTSSGTSSDAVSSPFSRISHILDAGPTRYRKSSTLVRIDGNSFTVPRIGVIDQRIIERFADFTILFLCSGNTCRSPMAAALAASQFASKLGIPASELPLRHILIQSAGLHASRGHRATPEAQDAVKPFAADVSAHISQPATSELLRRADIIYTMTAAHRDEVLELLPGAAVKTHRLDENADVEDPFGSSLSVYGQVAQRLNELIHRRVSELQI